MKPIMDIGSNSVRLRIFDGGKIVFNKKITSRLAADSRDGFLSADSMERTTLAVKSLLSDASPLGVSPDNVMAFATAAVRNSLNGKAYVNDLFEKTGVSAEIISGETEAEIGLSGALNGEDGGIIDIGGASSEIAVRSDGKIIYSHSLATGAVKLYDSFGEDFDALRDHTEKIVRDYGFVPGVKKLVGIGGTATSCAFALTGKPSYDPRLIQGFGVRRDDLALLLLRLSCMTEGERRKIFADPGRAKVIVCGASLLLSVLDYLGLDEYCAGEADNLEGYCLLKTGSL